MKYLFFIVMIFIIGCESKEPLREIKTENDWDIQLLFQFEGHKIYRFYDGGTRYFIIPSGTVLKVIPGDEDNPERVQEFPTIKE